MAGGRDVADTGRMEDGESGRRTHLAGKVEMWRSAHARDGDDIGQGRVVIDVTLDDVQEIDEA